MRQQSIDLNDVAVFAEVVGCGSFASAAQKLNMPRATVSRTVARLEAAVGVQLIYRTTRRMILTETGRQFHQSAEQGLGLIAAAQLAASQAKSEPSGLLSISVPTGFAVASLMPWLPDFLGRYPAVRLALRFVETPVDPLDLGVDLAILTGPQPDSSYMIRQLGTSRLVLVASPAYLQRAGVPASVSALADHDAILFKSSEAREEWTLTGPEGPVTVAVAGRVSVVGAFAELSAARAGLGIALLPEPTVSPFLEDGSLVRVLPEYGVGGGVISAVFPANRHQSAALRAFIDFLAEKISGQRT